MNDTPRETRLHERLRDLRLESGERLKDVCESAGLSVPYLSDLERGRTNPSLDTLTSLATHYGITVQKMLEGVSGYGEPTSQGLPRALQELRDDPHLNLNPDWINTLAKIELRGKRPRTKQDWYEIYLHLRRILN